MNRAINAIRFAAVAIAVFGLPVLMANAQGDGNRRPPRPHVIPWSFADYQPSVPRGRFTDLYIWHNRNTVHVETTDNHWFGDRFAGTIVINGGTFDNVKEEHDRDDTRFHQTSANRIVFAFRSEEKDVPGFKFNIHKGDRLVFHVALDKRRTGRIFYGSAKAPTEEDPVIFDLHK